MARIVTLADDARNQAVWRYMTFGRFAWLLQQRALWFSRADLLGDKWEGMPNKWQVDRALTWWDSDVAAGKPTPYANRDQAKSGLARVVIHVPLNSYVNCWTRRSAESHAMWRVYCPTSESVAIRTTLGRLYDSLPDRVELLGVRYDPAPAEIFGPIHLWLISQKRAAFEYESEIRAVVPAPPLQGELVSGRAGEQIDWDPSRHIASVTVHPEADAAFVQTVRGAVTALAPALTSVIETSALAIGPETAWRDNGTE